MKANNRLECARCAPDSQKRSALARGSAGALCIKNSHLWRVPGKRPPKAS